MLILITFKYNYLFIITIKTINFLIIIDSKHRKRGGKGNSCNEEEKSYTTERLTKIILQEEKLFCQKLNHEQEIHDLTMAHLRQKFAFETRTAAATANLAEFQLLKEKSNER